MDDELIKRNIPEIKKHEGVKDFPKMIQAIQDKNIRSVAEESHRKDVSPERNQDTIQKILQIIDWDY